MNHRKDKREKKVPVYDHAGVLMYHATPEKVQELLTKKDIDFHWNKLRLKSIRYRGPDPALQVGGSRYRRPIGAPHTHANYYNVEGCWHIDRIPPSYRPHFIAVLASIAA